MAKYFNSTVEDPNICPYCGSDGTDLIGTYEGEDKRWCTKCQEDYCVLYNDDSWDEEDACYLEIDDITDRHRHSLREKISCV